MIQALPQDERTTIARVTGIAAATTLLMGVLYAAVGVRVPVIFAVAAAYVAVLLAWRLLGSDLMLVRGLLGITLLGAPLIQYFAGGAGPTGMHATWAVGVAVSVGTFFHGREAWAWLPAFVLVMVGAAAAELTWPPEVAPRPGWFPFAMGCFHLVGVGLLCAFSLRWLVRQRDTALRDLAAEHLRSEKLLHITLPSSVADRLKQGAGTIADRLDATILFADIVGFTAVAREETPEGLVRLLDQLFSAFDELVEKHGLEKIKTIGDAYMVAGGVPSAKPGHQVAIAALALDMLKVVETLREAGGPRLRIRIGIHTGSVIAGVIGRQRLAYDLWGDAVNTASRMESHGEPDEIQLTAELREFLEQDFELTPRGAITIKGMGEISTWRLVGRKAS